MTDERTRLLAEIEALEKAQALMSNPLGIISTEIAYAKAALFAVQSATTEALAAMEQAREALKMLDAYQPEYTECHGFKCRRPWCASCFGEDAAEQAEKRARIEFAAARQALATLTEQIERMRNEQG